MIFFKTISSFQKRNYEIIGGFFNDEEGKEICKECPKGKYNPYMKKTAFTDCLDCPAHS